MTTTACITCNGINLEVTGDFVNYPGNRWEPAESDFHIDCVLIGGVDIYDLIDDEILTEISELAFAAVLDKEYEYEYDD